MTDLNKAGIEKAAKTIRPLISDEMRAHSTEYSVARAAITAYLDCVDANAGPYSDAKLLEGRDRFIINKGLWGEFVKQVEGLTAAPTPETREPSEEAPVKDSLTPSNHPEIPESWMLAEINRLREALQGIVDCAMSGSLFEELALDALENRGIDHQSALFAAPKAPSAEGWRPIESAPKDGTEVLVARVNSNGHKIIPVYFDGKFANYPWFDGAKFHEHNWPTHWMPLPPAPPMKGE